MKKILILFILFSIWSYGIHAQENVILKISGHGLETSESASIISKVESNASSFLTAVNNGFSRKSKPKFSSGILTADAQVSVLSMWEMSRFKCTSALIEERLIKKPQGGYEVRNIPIFMDEAPADEREQEMVLIFNSNGEIDNVYLSIETGRYNQLIGEGNDVTEFRRRQIILDFIENFRTAYNRKDADYLNAVFSEDALIITGKVVQVTKPDASGQFLSQQTVQYQKQTKKEYIDKLRRVFSSNAYINVKFDDIEIKQHKKYPSIYGVNMMQGWNTSRYSDVGYLLLVIDFSDDDKPQIHVRTWQPDKVGGKTLSQEEKFQLEQFNIKK
jgi:ketosteroid isomerase-like protein